MIDKLYHKENLVTHTQDTITKRRIRNKITFNIDDSNSKFFYVSFVVFSMHLLLFLCEE